MSNRPDRSCSPPENPLWRRLSLKARHLPNIISMARIALVWPIISLILEHRFAAALGLMILAGLSDALDGWLARHYHWQSRLGSLLDPAADKILLITGYLALTGLSLIPLWLTVTIVLRDGVILAGAGVWYRLMGSFEGQPLKISKLNTFLQLILLITCILNQVAGPFPPLLITVLIGLVFITTVASGCAYVLIWGDKYARARQHPGS
ncbi:CDP-alcohol phosphatidyltransferase family protein [Candidatus Woesearchaeota archaeon]|nr:CDP-alcohol phosphatidyltransferase family protein [Candidatus Woesearchaeota archaeon]